MNRSQATTVTIIIALATYSLSPDSAQAASFTATQENDPNTLISKLLGNTTGLDTSSFQVQTIGNAQAFGTFQNDPFNLKSGVVLSTGKVTDLPGINRCYTSCTDVSTDFPPLGTSGDRIQLRFDFVDNTADKLYFQYVFGSEELPEWAGSIYNDRFSLQLNGQNLAYLSDGTTTVNITNLARSQDLILNPPNIGPAINETKLDGYSKPLFFTGNLQKGKTNTLLVTIEDLGDGIYDSAVFLKAGTLSTVKPPDIPNVPTSCNPIPVLGGTGFTRAPGTGVPSTSDSGTLNCSGSNSSNPGGNGGNGGGGGSSIPVPESSSGLGILTFGIFGAGAILKHKNNQTLGNGGEETIAT